MPTVEKKANRHKLISMNSKSFKVYVTSRRQKNLNAKTAKQVLLNVKKKHLLPAKSYKIVIDTNKPAQDM